MKVSLPTATVLLAVLLALAGCPAPDSTTGTDQKRLDVMKSEPLVAKALEPPTAVAGFEVSKKLEPRRGKVSAKLFDQETDRNITTVLRVTAEAMAALRTAGWTVYFAACVPPAESASPQASPSPATNRVIPQPMEKTWRFQVYGYKVKDGVSYFASLSATSSTRSTMYLTLLAPNSHEKESDVFKDRPPAVTSTCIERSPAAAGMTIDGTMIVMDDDGPHPDGTPMEPGTR